MHKLTPAQRWTLILAPVNDIYLTLPSLPYCTTKYIILYEPGIRDSRPLFARNQGDAGIVSCAETDGGASRHRAFSHHCANLLATDPEVMQQLLQSQSTAYRLLGLKRVLMEAVEELSSLMVDDEFLSEEELDEIMDNAMSADDDDSDLMPPGECDGDCDCDCVCGCNCDCNCGCNCDGDCDCDSHTVLDIPCSSFCTRHM